MQQEETKAEPRTLEQIQAHYNQLCLRAGDLQYRIKCFQGDLEAANQALQQVNQEAAARKSLDDAAKASEAPAITPEVVAK